MKFLTNDVQLHGEYGFIRWVHGRAAHAMIRRGQATFEDPHTIRIRGGLSSLPRNEREVGRPSTTSIKTTFEQRLPCGAKVIQHKPVEDESLYGLRAYAV